MHRIHNTPAKGQTGPQTSGHTIHWAGRYDLFSRLGGMGVKGRNSRMIVELAGIKAREAVLDVACGTGNLTMAAQLSAGPTGKAYGIDASPEMIDVARKNSARRHSPAVFEVGLAEQLSFPDATFDVVISRLAMHHLPDELKTRAFSEMLRVLKPGGRLFITDFTPPANPLLNHLWAAMVGPGMMQTQIGTLLPIVSDAGFVEVASGPTRSSFLGFVSGKKLAT